MHRNTICTYEICVYLSPTLCLLILIFLEVHPGIYVLKSFEVDFNAQDDNVCRPSNYLPKSQLLYYISPHSWNYLISYLCLVLSLTLELILFLVLGN